MGHKFFKRFDLFINKKEHLYFVDNLIMQIGCGRFQVFDLGVAALGADRKWKALGGDELPFFKYFTDDSLFLGHAAGMHMEFPGIEMHLGMKGNIFQKLLPII